MTKKKLTLVIHGIGEQNPGETLDELVGASAGDDAGTVEYDIKWMRDEHAKTDPRAADLFPCHTRRVQANGTEMVFGEVYWADLSKGAKGFLFILMELVTLILSLGYVVLDNVKEQFRDEIYDPETGKTPPEKPSLKGRITRPAALWFVHGLHGPVVSLNVMAGVALLWVYLILRWYENDFFLLKNMHDFLIPLALVLTAATMYAVGLAFGGKKRGYLFTVFVSWFKYSAIGLLIVLLLREAIVPLLSDQQGILFRFPLMNCTDYAGHLLENYAINEIHFFQAIEVHCDFQWYAIAISVAQGIAWVGVVILIGLMILPQIFWPHDKTRDDMGEPLYAITAIAMAMFFILTAVTIWFAFVQFYDTLVVQEALVIAPNFEGFPNATRDFFISEKRSFTRFIPYREFQFLKVIALSSAAPVWMAAAIVFFSIIAVLVRRFFWRRRYERLSFAAGDVPRLIVGGYLRFGMIIAGLVILCGIMLLSQSITHVLNEADGMLKFSNSAVEFDFCRYLDFETGSYSLYLGNKLLCWGVPVSTAAAAAIVVVFPLIAGMMAVGLGVAKDIAGYFSFQTRDEDVANESPRQRIQRRVFKAGRQDYVLRDRINGRAFQVFDRLVRAEKPDEIVIISHSQGTVVAVEALHEGLINDLIKTNKNGTRRLSIPVSLVTMGSPTYHIYTKYFRSRFKNGRLRLLEDLKDVINPWINIYRVDDFVGTFIEKREGTFPQNRPVGPGGHTGYWGDKEVRDILEERVFKEFTHLQEAEKPVLETRKPVG